MSDSPGTRDLLSLADELAGGLAELDVLFDPAARLKEVKYARNRIAPLTPKVIEAAEAFNSYVSARVLKDSPVHQLRKDFIRASELLTTGSLNQEKCDQFCGILRDFTQTSDLVLQDAWRAFVDEKFDDKELVFMKVLCQNFVGMKDCGKRERDAAERGLKLAKDLETTRSRLPGQDVTRVRGQVIKVAKIAQDLIKVRDTLIGSDPDVKKFVRSVGQPGGVRLEDIPDSVWEWISDKGLSSAYAVTPAQGTAGRR